MNARKQKKTLTHFLNFQIKKKDMSLKLFEILEKSLIVTVLIQLTQFEKTGSIGSVFIPMRTPSTKIHFQNKKSIRFFATLCINVDSGICLPFNKAKKLKSNKIKRQT